MINFFRRIRRQLADDNKPLKYMRYEVFKKRLNNRFGNVSYPTDKAFDIWAWTCMNLERAKKKLLVLSKTHHFNHL